MSSRTVKGDVVVDYLEKFPKMANKTLAKKIYKENNEIFASIEAVRNTIRYYKGSFGDRQRKYSDQDADYHTGGKFWEGHNTYNDEKKYEPYTLPKGEDNILLLSDIHIPYQDNAALKAAIEYGKSEKVNTIILNGDILDFYTISKYAKAPNKPSMTLEIDMCRAFLKSLREDFPNARIYYKEGNHELRWYSYLILKSPELFGMAIMELDDVIGMTGFGVTPIKDNRMMLVGDLTILHGHEVKVSSVDYPAAALFRKTMQKSICGHLHKTDSFKKKQIGGNYIHTYVTGCLSTLKVEFAIYNQWNHGFAHIKVDRFGQAEVNNIAIYNGKIK